MKDGNFQEVRGRGLNGVDGIWNKVQVPAIAGHICPISFLYRR